MKAVQKRICTNKLNVNNMNEILFAGDKLYKYAKKKDISWLFRAMWFAILFFTWQPALSLESEKKKKHFQEI